MGLAGRISKDAGILHSAMVWSTLEAIHTLLVHLKHALDPLLDGHLRRTAQRLPEGVPPRGQSEPSQQIEGRR